MRLLAFEYACAGGPDGHSYLNEGRRMLAALIHDLSRAGLTGLSTLLQPPCDLAHAGCGAIPVTEGLFDAARTQLQYHDAVWIIAPETGGGLLALTRLAESLGVRVIGSSSDAVELCGDKFLFSRRLRGTVKHPDTRPFEGVFDVFPCIIKPADGAGCADTFLAQTPDELSRLPITRSAPFIVQPFIAGDHFSAGIVSHRDEVELLGVCRQNISIGPSLCFEGLTGPLAAYPHIDAVRELAQKVKTAVPGLRGYWGIDFVDDGRELTLIEVNPRLTSSYPLYSAAGGFNLAHYAITGEKQ